MNLRQIFQMVFFVVILSIVVGAAAIFKFRDRLTFRRGLLSRQGDRTLSSITRMGTVKFIRLSFGSVRYVYRPSSSSGPLNVFVHGFSIPMEIWQNVFVNLADDDHPCLAFDLYGRGWSDSPDIPMNIDLFVSQLAELLFALNLSHEKLHLFGVSMGGAIVQRFTELYRTKVVKLVLCCSAGLKVTTPPAIMSVLSLPILGSLLFKFIMQRGDDKKIRAQWAFPDKDEYRQYRNLFEQTCREHPGYLRGLFSTLIHFELESSLKTAQNLNEHNLPVLIIWGDKDTLITVDNAHRYHEIYSNSSLTIIHGANHSLLIEHPQPAIEAIRTFLATK